MALIMPRLTVDDIIANRERCPGYFASPSVSPVARPDAFNSFRCLGLFGAAGKIACGIHSVGDHLQ